MAEMTAKKGNRLTLYIIIALFAGIGLGFWLNSSYVKDENRLIAANEAVVGGLQTEMKTIGDTTGIAYKELAIRKKEASTAKNASLESRDKKLEPFSLLADIFIRLIKMIVAPLVFSTLVVGVAKLGDIQSVGRIGGKTLLWFFGASFISLLLGLMLVNFFQPGIAMKLPLPDVTAVTGIKKTALTLREFLYHVFPSSAIDAMAKNEILQIVVFSLFFGVATAAIGEKGQIVIKALDAISHVILKVTAYVMNFAPLAVFGAM